MHTLWTFILALIGFAVSWYIFRKKNRGEKLMCAIGDDCDKVVKSSYSKVLGIPNEVLGMLYYAAVALVYVAPFEVPPIALLIFTGAAAFYSLVLTFIQAFIIREWCEYCLVSAATSIALFLLLVIL